MGLDSVVVGEFIGGLIGTAVLTFIWYAVLKPIASPDARLVTASALSLFTAVAIVAYGFAYGTRPDFVAALGKYVLPQLVVLVAMSWQLGRNAKRAATSQPAAVGRAGVQWGRQPVAAAVPSIGRRVAAVERVDEVVRTVPQLDYPNTSNNFIVRHWRGELPLGVSYWAVAFATNIAAQVFVGLVTALFKPDAGFEPTSIFYTMLLLWAGIAALLTWQVVGLWRSANRHSRNQRRANKTVFWAVAAQIMVFLGVLQNVGEFVRSGVPQVRELYRMAYQGDPNIPDTELRLLPGGRELSLHGGIKYGTAADVERLLDAAPDVTVIHLTSGGGRIAEAYTLFDVIRKHRLATYVSSECASACTLAFAAGSKRWLADAARLGYHGPHFPGLSQDEQRAMADDFAQMYRQAGLKDAFVKKAMAVSPDDIWYPTVDELTQANAVTDIDKGENFATSGYEAAPTLAAIEKEMRAGSGVIDALHLIAPEDAKRIYALSRSGGIAGRSQDAVDTDVQWIIYRAVKANVARADDNVVAQYASLYADQYDAIRKQDPAVCFRYLVFGEANSMVPSELIIRENQLNEEVLRTALGRPVSPIVVDEETRSLLLAGLTSDEKIIIQVPEDEVPAQYYNAYCSAAVRMFRNMVQLGDAKAAMLMRDYFAGS